MANFLDIAGGIGTGLSQGFKDQQDMEMHKQRLALMKQQQDLAASTLAKAQDEEAARKEVKGLARPGSKVQVPNTAYPEDGTVDMTPLEKSYSEAQHAKDSAGIYRKYGLSRQANEESDRAQTAMERDRQNAVMDLIRRAPGMSLEQYATEAANLKTGDDTHVNAAVFKDPQTGALSAAVYHTGKGQQVMVPLQNHEQISDMLLASLGPQYYTASRKLKQGDITAGAEATKAEAAKQKAATDAAELDQKVLAGLFPAQAGEMRSRGKYYDAEAAIAPARGRELDARANFQNAHADQARAVVNNWENKLPEGQKMYLAFLKDNALKLNQLAAQDPTFQPKAAVAMMNIFDTYKKLGMPGAETVDPYAAAGVVNPVAVAQDLVKRKANPKQVDEALALATKAYGPDYAAKVKEALPTASPAAPGASTGGPAPTPLGIDKSSPAYQVGSRLREGASMLDMPGRFLRPRVIDATSQGIEGVGNFVGGLTRER